MKKKLRTTWVFLLGPNPFQIISDIPHCYCRIILFIIHNIPVFKVEITSVIHRKYVKVINCRIYKYNFILHNLVFRGPAHRKLNIVKVQKKESYVEIPVKTGLLK